MLTSRYAVEVPSWRRQRKLRVMEETQTQLHRGDLFGDGAFLGE